MNNPLTLGSESAWEEMLIPEDRLDEIASILAKGALRVMAKDKSSTQNIVDISSISDQTKTLILRRTNALMSLSRKESL